MGNGFCLLRGNGISPNGSDYPRVKQLLKKRKKNKGSSNSQKSVGCAKPRGSVLLP